MRVRVPIKGKTNAEVRLALSPVALTVIIRWSDLIPEICPPIQLFRVLKDNDPLWRQRLEIYGFSEEEISHLREVLAAGLGLGEEKG